MLVRYAPDVEVADPDFEALDRGTSPGHEGRVEDDSDIPGGVGAV